MARDIVVPRSGEPLRFFTKNDLGVSQLAMTIDKDGNVDIPSAGGGGLTVVLVTVTGTTPSVTAMESGKHYVVDMSAAIGDVDMAAPAGAAGVEFRLGVEYGTAAHTFVVNVTGADFSYGGDIATTPLQVGGELAWVQCPWDTNNLFFTVETAGAGGSTQGPWLDISAQLTANHAGTVSWEYALGRFSEPNPGEYVFDAKLRLASTSTDTGEIYIDLDGVEVAYDKQTLQVDCIETITNIFNKYTTSEIVLSNPTPVSAIASTGGTQIPDDGWQLQATYGSNSGFAQPFTLASDTLITEAEIYFAGLNTLGGEINVDIVSTLSDPAWPGTVLVDLGSVEVTSLSPGFSYEKFVAAAPVLITAGTYYLRFYTSNWNGSNTVYVNKITSDDGGYLGELMYWNGGMWASSASDIVYKLYEGSAVADITRMKWTSTDSRDSWNIDAQNVLVDRIPTWYNP